MSLFGRGREEDVYGEAGVADEEGTFAYVPLADPKPVQNHKQGKDRWADVRARLAQNSPAAQPESRWTKVVRYGLYGLVAVGVADVGYRLWKWRRSRT